LRFFIKLKLIAVQILAKYFHDNDNKYLHHDDDEVSLSKWLIIIYGHNQI